MVAILNDSNTWVAVSFVIFFGILVYFGVHRFVLSALDDRAKRIKDELDEAKRLREEAAGLLAEYQRRRAEAETEAEAIIADAKADAERVAAEARARVEDFVARRTALAENKIANAEAQALAEVRAAAADAAVSAAAKVLADTTKGEIAERLLTQGIADVRAKLN